MYNNPYLYQNLSRGGLLSRLFGYGRGLSLTKINWGNLLSNTQKSLGIINQAIPIVNQVKPMVNNAKTMFKVASILKDDNKSTDIVSDNTIKVNTNKPIFYI